MKQDNYSNDISIRQKASDKAKIRGTKSGLNLSEAETLTLINELEIHQIELEMMEEEVMLARNRAEIAAKKADTALQKYTECDSALKESKAVIERQNKQLQDYRDKFNSIVDIDLRSPFTSLLALSEMITDEGRKLSMEEYINLSKVTRNSVENVHNSVENLLSLMLHNGSIIYLPMKLSLPDMFSQSIEWINGRAMQKGITVYRESTGVDYIYADDKMIAAVLRYLLDTAVKSTQNNGKVILTSKEMQDGKVELSVTYTGIGISGDLIGSRSKLREKAGKLGTDGERSSAIEFNLCAEFVEMHNGKIWVETQEGIGGSFCFTLPKCKG